MTEESAETRRGTTPLVRADEEPSRAPRRRRKDARPAEIVEAGLAEFAEKGFAATRLDDVARRAGVAKGTIYLYFADKEALFTAAVQSLAGPVIGGLEAHVDAFEGPTAAILEAIIRTVYARMIDAELRPLLRIMIAEGGRFPALPALYHREVLSRALPLLERVIARGVARGEVRAGAAADLPMVLMAPAIMAAVWKLTFEPVEPVATERFLAAHLDLIRNGLLTVRPDGRLS
jgi:AcrR family transcriptional regulator